MYSLLYSGRFLPGKNLSKAYCRKHLLDLFHACLPVLLRSELRERTCLRSEIADCSGMPPLLHFVDHSNKVTRMTQTGIQGQWCA